MNFRRAGGIIRRTDEANES